MRPLFISDWGPMPALEEDSYTRALGELGAALKPRAVIIVSGHWQAHGTVEVSGKADIIYDYYGFPEQAYDIKYPLRHDDAFAGKVIAALGKAGMDAAMADRGIDHGAWVPLIRLFPSLDAPVVQLSLPMEPGEAYAVGKALAPLAKEGVLIIGSGALSHNLMLALSNPKEAAPEAWAEVFNAWVLERVIRGELEELFAYRTLAPFALKAAPTPDHFTPLFFSIGAGAGKPEIIYEKMVHGNGMMLIARF